MVLKGRGKNLDPKMGEKFSCKRGEKNRPKMGKIQPKKREKNQPQRGGKSAPKGEKITPTAKLSLEIQVQNPLCHPAQRPEHLESVNPIK